MFDLNGLAIFVRVAEAGSFSEAARRLGMPVSTVSRRLAELETQLGVRLLERSTRRLRLTEIGLEVLSRCQRGLEAFEEAQLLISSRHDEVRGRLRLSAPPSLTDSHIAPLCLDFRKAYPAVELSVMITDRRTDLIADGVDVALRVGPQADSALITRPLLRYRHLLVATPGYLSAHGNPQAPDDLRQHSIAAFGGTTGDLRWRLEKGAEKRKLQLRAAIGANDFTLPLKAALRGEAIAEMPAIACLEQLCSGALKEVMRPWRFPSVDLSILHLSRSNMSPVVRAFSSFCVDHSRRLFQDLPDESWAPTIL